MSRAVRVILKAMTERCSVKKQGNKPQLFMTMSSKCR